MKIICITCGDPLDIQATMGGPSPRDSGAWRWVHTSGRDDHAARPEKHQTTDTLPVVGMMFESPPFPLDVLFGHLLVAVAVLLPDGTPELRELKDDDKILCERGAIPVSQLARLKPYLQLDKRWLS